MMTDDAMTRSVSVAVRPEPPDELKSFFGERPLIRGEDPSVFEALRDRIAEAVGPQDAMDWLWVSDLATAAWDAQRARRLSAQLYEAARKEAIQTILSDLLQHEIPGAAGRRQHCHATAAEWLQAGRDGEAAMAEFLATYGLEPEVVTAEIFRLRADALERLDRMAAAADRRRDLVIREIERRRRDRAEHFRRACEDLHDHDAVGYDSNGWVV
jgi:hypothetical protein